MNAMLFALLVASETDPPERAARVSEATGELFLFAAGGEEWEPFERNRPVLEGDAIFSDGDGRAEVDLGTGKLWLDYASGLHFQRFEPADVGATFEQGSLRYEKRSMSDTLTVAVERAQVVIEGRGRGRIDRAGGNVTVSVDEGGARVVLGGFTYELVAEESLLVRGGSVRVTDDLRRADAFDEWVALRPREAPESDAYVAPTVAGRAELDRYGVWQKNAEYGAVWFPSVATEWAPYRDGHWVETAAYGWTWVDDAPWGYAPFHYGRWVLIGTRWAWCPGPRVMHVAFAPALVHFVTIAAEIAWVPLGVYHAYRPAFPCSERYASAINRPWQRARAVDALGIAALPGWTRVSREVFVERRPVREVAVVTRPRAFEVLSAPPISLPKIARRIEAPVLRVPPPVVRRVVEPPRVVVAPPVVVPREPVHGSRGRFEVIMPRREPEAARPSIVPTRPIETTPAIVRPSVQVRPWQPEVTRQIVRPSEPVRPWQPQLVRPSTPAPQVRTWQPEVTRPAPQIVRPSPVPQIRTMPSPTPQIVRPSPVPQIRTMPSPAPQIVRPSPVPQIRTMPTPQIVRPAPAPQIRTMPTPQIVRPSPAPQVTPARSAAPQVTPIHTRPLDRRARAINLR